MKKEGSITRGDINFYLSTNYFITTTSRQREHELTHRPSGPPALFCLVG